MRRKEKRYLATCDLIEYTSGVLSPISKYRITRHLPVLAGQQRASSHCFPPPAIVMTRRRRDVIQ
jgi:hypothetical protein